MALAAPELLDKNLLLDAAVRRTPDQAGVRTAAVAMADAYRRQNNEKIPAPYVRRCRRCGGAKGLRR